MMYNDVKVGDIPILSFLKHTNYAMYVGPELSEHELFLLRDLDITVPVIYLPEVLEGLTDDKVKYNFPGVTIPESLTVENIYAQIMKEFEGRITPQSRLIVMYNMGVLMMFDAKETGGTFDQLLAFLKGKYSRYPRSRRNRALIAKRNLLLEELRKYVDSNFEEKFEEMYKKEILPYLSEPQAVPEYEPNYDSVADVSFKDDMDNATKEAEMAVKNLLLNGCPPEMILSWVNQSVKISRIRITRQFKIFLTDYDNTEIKMGPLPKTVFLFFLRHPEGVMFSHLQDYRKELRMIYGHVCTNDDPQKIEESVKRLVDPLDNSISEKCAAVKKAFVLKIADNIASNYYVAGTQGERKGISLDRSLVDWECQF